MEQINLFDSLLERMSAEGQTASSREISDMIDTLKSLRSAAVAREKNEKQRIAELEAQRAQKEAQEIEQARIDKITSMDLPLDWENAFSNDMRVEGVHAESVQDGLILSLNNLGRVDIEYISSVSGETLKDVISTLKGAIYQNPDTWGECFYKGWETADEYLSGNLIRKRRAAREANDKYNGYFAGNIAAIDAVLPEAVPANDIYITLGSPWVPVDIIDDFITHLFGHCYYADRAIDLFGVRYDAMTGSWTIPDKNRYGHKVSVMQTYGTKRMPALYILEKTLNMKTVQVFDEIPCVINASGKRRTVNRSETLLAVEKQKKLIDAFKKWVWSDDKRKARLQEIFEERYGCVRTRKFDGSFLTFPTMSKGVGLYPYQKNAVARILFSPNTLLAHDVGSGKTYIMIAAGMELKRMGLSEKNLYVVPNNLVGQWKSIFDEMYPGSDVLCVTPSGFTPDRRESVLGKIRTGSYDGIIMAYSCFAQIPVSDRAKLTELIATKHKIATALRSQRKSTDALNKKFERVTKELEAMYAGGTMRSGETFDKLGITRLFVDEAHNFKNVPIETQVDRVLGISRGGSGKCKDMLEKVRLVQKANGGGGVVFATGTPITNSITDAYIMQNYLQSGELALLDLQSFDSWVGMFAEKVTEFEVDVDTSSFRLATRFAKFHNLTELTNILASVADFHRVDMTDGIPEFDGYTDSVITKTAEFDGYLKTISERADRVRSGVVERTEDNMLKITTDGRQAALDMRLVDGNARFRYESKVARCAENVYAIYRRTEKDRLTQLVFCDTSTPKAGFNIYDELRSLLIGMGVKPQEIEFIHNAESERSRSALFSKMRSGAVRVLIGSTFKLGLGVNVQDKLVAVHHLDVPWRPADMTQREGRILRQGNTNARVFIYRYITEGSFDAYSWQLLETKQRFICELLSGSLSERSGADVDDTVLNYAEVKALAVGNPLIKERVETANELSRYLTLQRKLVDTRLAMERELSGLPEEIAETERRRSECVSDMEAYAAQSKELSQDERKAIREKLHAAVADNVFAVAESELMEYKGFTVILPSGMTSKKPFVWLARAGRYYVEMGDSGVGDLIRLDNFLENFDAHLARIDGKLSSLAQRKADIAAELAKNENYDDAIEKCRAKLKKIDKKLGVTDD